MGNFGVCRHGQHSLHKGYGGTLRKKLIYSADRVKKAIEEDGGECLCLALDLMKSENCQKIVDEHIKKYGGLDILVNNASKQSMCKDIAEIEVS